MMKFKIIFVLIVTIFVLPLLSEANETNENAKIVITQSDEDTIRRLLTEYSEEWRKYTEAHRESSSIPMYLDCESYRNLLKYGLKVVPYLVENLAIAESRHSDYGWIGSSIISDENVRTPEQVYNYNRNPTMEIHKQGELYPPPNSARQSHGSPLLIMQLLPNEMIPKPQIREGYVDDGKFAWSHWWQLYKDRFDFQTNKMLEIKPTEVIHSTVPHIGTIVKDGLLYIEAVSATYKQIIERAAAEMDIKVFIGEQRDIDVITTVRMKGVTFEEFLYMIGRTVYVGGFDYRKTETGYWVGGEKPAKPRRILNGWGIMMDKTVFSVGDEIPVTVITREKGLTSIIDPNDSEFLNFGSFRVTTNDGKIVQDYSPIVKSELYSTMPPIKIEKDCFPIQVYLNKYCNLPAGEYNIRFRYIDNETPSIAIEIYDRSVK